MHAPLLALLAAATMASASYCKSSYHAAQGQYRDDDASVYSTDSTKYNKDARTYSESPFTSVYGEHYGEHYVKPYKGDRDASILEILRKDRRFTKLVSALTRAGGSLRDDLDDPNAKNKITLLSPTDEAFEVLEKMHGKSVETMDENMLQKILAYHVIPASEHDGLRKMSSSKNNKYVNIKNHHEGGLRKEQLCDGETLETALIEKRLGDHEEVGNRQRVRVTKYSGKVILNMYSQVIDSDVEASNGVIHALSDVLLLPEQLFSGIATLPNMFSTQALALKLTGLDKRVNEEAGVTALVPSNSAYESMGFFQTMEMFHPSNRDELKSFLERHYISEPLYVNELIDEEAARGTRAGATCLAAKRNDVRFFDARRHAKRNAKYTSKTNSAYSYRNNEDDDEKEIIEREYETWAGDKVMLRVECHEGGVDVLFDNTVVALADIPSSNGVLHVLTQPIDNHTSNKRDNDDGDNDDDVYHQSTAKMNKNRKHRKDNARFNTKSSLKYHQQQQQRSSPSHSAYYSGSASRSSGMYRGISRAGNVTPATGFFFPGRMF